MVYKLAVVFRNGAGNDAGAHRFSTSSKTGNDLSAPQSQSITTDAAAAASTDLRENNHIDSAANHSRHDHQYSRKCSEHFVQVREQKRKSPYVSDHWANSGLSRVDTELADNHSIVSSRHSARADEEKNEEQSTEKTVCEVSDRSKSPVAHLLSNTVDKSVEFSASDSVITETEMYVCDFGGTTFDVRQELRKHVSEVHTGKACDDTDDDQSATDTVSQMNTAVAEKHGVQQKAKKTSKDDAVEVCEICGWIRSKSKRLQSLKHHMIKHSTEKPFKCSKCSQTFKHTTNLKRHEILHGNVRRFLCQYCAKSFHRKYVLRRHIFTCHSDEVNSDLASCGGAADGTTAAGTDSRKRRGPTRAFSCNICDMHFTSLVRLDRHMSVHGTGDIGSAYRCQLCGEQFELMTALESHVSKVHTIFRPRHKCTECERHFSSESQLKYHMRVHTPNAITCTVCDRKFVSQSALMIHMMSHTGTRPGAHKSFSCSVCGKQLSSKVSLQQHEFIHSRAKPFVCNVCDRAFTQVGHLYRHRRIHTTARPYCCSLCSKTYRRTEELRFHCTRVHDVELPVRNKKV